MACSQAADELKAARTLIDSLQKELEMTRDRLDLERLRVGLLAEKNALLQAQIEGLQGAVDATKRQNVAMGEVMEKLRAQNAKLEAAKSKRSRTMWGIVAGALLTGVLLSR